MNYSDKLALIREYKSQGGKGSYLSLLRSYGDGGNLPTYEGYGESQLPKNTTQPIPIPVIQKSYEIQRGDTLTSIAKQYNTTVEELAKNNSISNPDLIYAGNSLNIPRKYDRELTTNQIPQEYHPNRIIDDYSPKYDYIVQGDKVFYRVKNGNTWADISDNTPAKTNLYEHLNFKHGLKGYSAEEKDIYNKLHNNEYNYNEAYDKRYSSIPPTPKQSGIPHPSEYFKINNDIDYEKTLKLPYKKELYDAQIKFYSNKTKQNEGTNLKVKLPDILYTYSAVPNSNFNKGLTQSLQKDDTEPVKNIIKDKNKTIFDKLYDFIDESFTLGVNYIDRQIDKISNEREPNTKFEYKDIDTKSNYNIRRPEITGDTLSIDNKRYYLPEIIDLDKVKLGIRNRGDLKERTTKGAIVTAFNPFVPFNTLDPVKIKPSDSFIGIDNNGHLKVGNYNDFDETYNLTKTFKNTVIDFVRDDKNEIVYTNRNKDNPKNPVPNVKILDDNGNIVIGSLNILTKKGRVDSGTYGNITGGRTIMTAGEGKDKKTILVSGSMNDIEREFVKLRDKYGKVDIYSLDNGSYTKALRTRDQKLTSEQLKAYDLQNSSGGNFAYLDGIPENKYPEKFYQTPNIRTEADRSYALGHPLKNEVKAVVLHHTAYMDKDLTKSDVKNGRSVHDQYMTPNENSSHVVIGFNGERNVYANPEQVTFHAGESKFLGRDNVNDFALGLEFQGDTNKKHLTEDQIYSAVEYLYPIIQKYNIPLENITTHALIAPGRKPDINTKDYEAIINILKQMIYEEK